LSGTSGQIFHLEKGTNYKHACPQLLDYFQLCPFAPPCSDDILELSEHVPLSPLLGNIDLTRCIVGGCGAVFFLLDFEHLKFFVVVTSSFFLCFFLIKSWLLSYLYIKFGTKAKKINLEQFKFTAKAKEPSSGLIF
jgi:hypothetical protein